MSGSLGSRLRQIREERNLSLDEVAAKLELSSADLGAVEAGERTLSHQEVMDLCNVLDVPIDELFKAEESDAPREGESLLIPADKLSALLDEMKDGE